MIFSSSSPLFTWESIVVSPPYLMGSAVISSNDIYLPGHCEVNKVAHCDGEVDLVGKPDKLTGKGKHNTHLLKQVVDEGDFG